jgi:hypothetical protein
MPAAACQGSWASAEDIAAAEDSEGDGSWATVSDESEQEKLQQQQAEEGMLHAAQHATMNEQHKERTEDATSLGADSRSSSSLGGSPDPTLGLSSQKIFEDKDYQLQQQQGQQDLFMPPAVYSDMPGQHTPQRARQDTEQAASPVSCESSMLAGSLPACRMRAEVVFSPMKTPPVRSDATGSKQGRAGLGGPAAATAGPDGINVTPLRQRNVRV